MPPITKQYKKNTTQATARTEKFAVRKMKLVEGGCLRPISWFLLFELCWVQAVFPVFTGKPIAGWWWWWQVIRFSGPLTHTPGLLGRWFWHCHFRLFFANDTESQALNIVNFDGSQVIHPLFFSRWPYRTAFEHYFPTLWHFYLVNWVQHDKSPRTLFGCFHVSTDVLVTQNFQHCCRGSWLMTDYFCLTVSWNMRGWENVERQLQQIFRAFFITFWFFSMSWLLKWRRGWFLRQLTFLRLGN